MSIQAVFFDIDGTLYDHQADRIPPEHLDAIRQLRKKGCKVALCTGRALPLIENLFAVHPGDWDGIVAGSGAYVYNSTLECLSAHPVSAQAADQVFAWARAHAIPVFASGNCMILTDPNERSCQVLQSVHVHQVPVRQPQNQDEFSVLSLCRPIESLCTPILELEAIPEIRLQYPFLTTDILPDGISKYEGIRKLMKHWGLENADYLAFGDSINDLEMIEHARIGVAMGNACDELKEKADAIAPDCHEGGIALWLRQEGYIT